jgi:hypothetical protein
MTLFKRRRAWILGAAVVVIVGIAVAVAILLRPTGSASSGGATATPTLIASLCTAGASPAPFMSAEGAGAEFPCPPTRSVLTVPTPLGTIQTIVYVSEVEGKRYEIMIADYGTVFSGGLTGILRGIVLDRTKASTMDEYRMKERSSQSSTLNEASGLAISADDGTRAARLRLYVVGKKLYRIGVAAPLNEVDNAAYMAFLDSFVIPAE